MSSRRRATGARRRIAVPVILPGRPARPRMGVPAQGRLDLPRAPDHRSARAGRHAARHGMDRRGRHRASGATPTRRRASCASRTRSSAPPRSASVRERPPHRALQPRTSRCTATRPGELDGQADRESPTPTLPRRRRRRRAYAEDRARRAGASRPAAPPQDGSSSGTGHRPRGRSGGAVARNGVAAEDITEQKRAEEELQRLLRRARSGGRGVGGRVSGSLRCGGGGGRGEWRRVWGGRLGVRARGARAARARRAGADPRQRHRRHRLHARARFPALQPLSRGHVRRRAGRAGRAEHRAAVPFARRLGGGRRARLPRTSPGGRTTRSGCSGAATASSFRCRTRGRAHRPRRARAGVDLDLRRRHRRARGARMAAVLARRARARGRRAHRRAAGSQRARAAPRRPRRAHRPAQPRCWKTG